MSYPAPQPVTFPSMLQSWYDLTFLHWRYPRDVVQQRVPPPLQVETFDGSAWVGVVPFVIHSLRPPFLPALPWISRFPETNCRTYVKAPDGSTGVWFFSLDAARAAAVAAARLSYGLPYEWSRMRVTRTDRRVLYHSERIWPSRPARTHIHIDRGNPTKSGDLEIFLTARFRLYSFLFGHLSYADIEHPPWPLETVSVLALDQTLTAAAGLPSPSGMPLAHFSPAVHVRIARPHWLRSTR